MPSTATSLSVPMPPVETTEETEQMSAASVAAAGVTPMCPLSRENAPRLRRRPSGGTVAICG
eukprot:5183011-Lingulodinium_polyedra.AAC.1